MAASTPRIEARSEHTLDCRTDAILLREGPGALCSSYLRGSSPGLAGGPPSASASASSVSVSVTAGTPATRTEPPPFLVRRSAFPAAGMAFVVRPGPATKRIAARARALARKGREAHAPPAVPAPSSRGTACVGAFALGAAAAAFAGHLTGRTLEAAALACLVAGIATLFAGLSCGKGRAARRGD